MSDTELDYLKKKLAFKEGSYERLVKVTRQIDVARRRQKVCIAAGKKLADAVEHYKNEHDVHGDGSLQAGRAWDLMTRANEQFRASVSALEVAMQ